MALNLNGTYGATAAPVTGNYPQGEPNDSTAPGALNGLPFQEAWVKDIYGYFQRLLYITGVTASGTPDTALVSEYFDAVTNIISQNVNVSGVTSLDPASYKANKKIYVNANTAGGSFTLTILDIPVGNAEQKPVIQIDVLGGYDCNLRATNLGAVSDDLILRSGTSTLIAWDGSGYTLISAPDSNRVKTVTADLTIGDKRPQNTFIINNAVNEKLTVTLPTAADNDGKILTFIKGNSNYGSAVIDGEGAETINGLLNAVLFRQYETIKIQCDGTGWLVINNWKLLLKSGMISRNEWGNRHIGIIELVGAIAGTFEQWETVIEATSNYRGIIISVGASLYLVYVDDGSGGAGGFFTNSRIVTGQKSSATITLSANTKDVDSNVYHGLGVSANDIKTSLAISTDGTGNNIVSIWDSMLAWRSGSTGTSKGHNFIGVDSNQFIPQTGGIGLEWINNSGTEVGAFALTATPLFYEWVIRNK